MQIINNVEATSLKQNWQELRPEKIVTAFETYNSKQGHYDRVTGIDFGTVKDEFTQQIKTLNVEGLDSACLYLGVDETTGLIKIFFEVSVEGELFFYAGERLEFLTYLTPNDPRYKPYVGVPVTYKNEVCSNWAYIEYYEIGPSFYSRVQTVSGVLGVLVEHPKRAHKFIIPPDDINVMKHKLESGCSMKLYFGINAGHSTRQLVGFTPVIEIAPPVTNKVKGEGDDDDPTYLDFVHACPPNCDPDLGSSSSK